MTATDHPSADPESAPNPESELPSHVMGGLLRALVTQIESVIGDVDEAMLEMEEAFVDLTGGVDAEPGSADGAAHRRVLGAMQFHDRMEQRLRHVCRALDEVSELLESKAEALHLEHWHALADSLRRASAIERDKHVFDALASGTRPADVQIPAGESAPGEMELF